MRIQNWVFTFALTAGLGMISGCAEPVPAKKPQVTKTAQQDEERSPKARPASPTPDRKSKRSKETTAKSATLPKFDPPFPKRELIFQPSAGRRITANKSEDQGSVKLKGFANVDGIRVFLVVGGQPVALRSGDTYSDIKVVVIEPPRVTLQRGRVRWTESLDNVGTPADL